MNDSTETEDEVESNDELCDSKCSSLKMSTSLEEAQADVYGCEGRIPSISSSR